MILDLCNSFGKSDSMFAALLLLATFSLLGADDSGQDWPRFLRAAYANGISDENGFAGTNGWPNGPKLVLGKIDWDRLWRAFRPGPESRAAPSPRR